MYLIAQIRLLCLTVCTASLLVACGGGTPPATEAEFCQTLNAINQNPPGVEKQQQIQGHTEILALLLKAAPPAIEDQLQSLHDLFAHWAVAGDGLIGQFQLFNALSDPELAALEGEIADYMISTCGLDLPVGNYHVHLEEDAAPVCEQWPRIGSPLTGNRFPNYLDTSGGNYFMNQFWSVPIIPAPEGFLYVPRGGVVEYNGEYPKARYFAYHPNDKSTNNLKTLVDVDLNPDPGSVNPYRQVPQPGESQRYTARYVFTAEPENPAPNTSYVGESKTGGYNPIVLSLLRVYASDQGSSANSAGVKLPAITIYDAEGEQISHYEECDIYPDGPQTVLKETTRFPVVPLVDHRTDYPVRWDSASQFNLPVDILANADAQYFNTTFSHRFGELFVVRAKAFTAPDTRGNEPVSVDGKDVRFWTVCTYNFWAGRAGSCLLDNEVALDEQGYYTLVISPENLRPDNIGERNDTWLDWGPYLDTQMTFRMGLRNNPKLQKMKQAIDGGEIDPAIAPYKPQAIACSKALYEQAGWQGCADQVSVK